MAQRKIKIASDQRKFTLVYNDFLECQLLDKHEKLVYIAIKRFADNDTLKAFPSLKRLHQITGISIRWIKKSIEHMEALGVISVEHRDDDKLGHQSNIYTLYDYAELWNAGNCDDVKTVADEILESRLVEELRTRGYTVTKEKGLESEPTKVKTQAPNQNIYSGAYDNMDSHKSQEKTYSGQEETYSMHDIRGLYNYDILINDHPDHRKDIEVVFDILHDTLNCRKESIRVSAEDKPRMIVISRLMKLDSEDIWYSIRKYHEQTERVKNVRGYILTILFHSHEQRHLDMMNLGHFNGDF